jgi:hypothetical protein
MKKICPLCHEEKELTKTMNSIGGVCENCYLIVASRIEYESFHSNR